jgi:hypothetical protein
MNRGYPYVFPDIVPRKFEADGHSGIDHAPGVALQRCVAAADMLTRLAASAAKRVQHRIRRGRQGEEARYRGDVPLRRFVGDLHGIYRDVYDRLPGISRPSRGGEAGGPFIRFVQAALKPLGIQKSGEAIAALIPGRRRRRRIVKSEPKES